METKTLTDIDKREREEDRHRDIVRQRDRVRESNRITGFLHPVSHTGGEGERENSKTLFYKDCILGSVKKVLAKLRESERERELENFILQGL